MEISNTLLYSLIDVCRKCDDVFLNHQDALNVFSDKRLKSWQDRLPEATSVGSRIERIIHYLLVKENANGENALFLLLHVLSERYPSYDDRHGLLLTFANQLQRTTSFSLQTPEEPHIESNPLAVPMHYVAESESMLNCARAVGRIEVSRYRKGIRECSGTGTGWLLAPGLVVTCWHVVAAQLPTEPSPEQSDLALQLEQMLMSFNYTQIGKGTQYSIASLIYPPYKTYQEQDFAILRLCDRPDKPYTELGYLPIETDLPFTAQTSLYIIQHPLGQPQQATCNNFVSFSTTSGRILYKTPTEKGTSGAPVLNHHNWHVVALHNGENASVQLREGTTIGFILDELQRETPDLYHEIEEAQIALGNSISSQHCKTSSIKPHSLSSSEKTYVSSSLVMPTSQDEIVPDIAVTANTETSFFSSVLPVQMPSRRLQSMQDNAKMDKHFITPVQQQQRPKSRIPPHEGGVFQERPNEFDILLDKLSGKYRTPCVALVGMGGRGKSRLAYEIVQRLINQGSFPDGIYWMTPHITNNLPVFSDNQTRKSAWEADFAQLALGSEYLPSNDNESSRENTGRRARYICDYLVSCPGALIVFDDVEDPEYAVKALPQIAGCEASCAILYTSRHRNIPDTPYEASVYVHEVERLPNEAARDLLLEKRPSLLEAIKSDKNSVEASAAHTILEVVDYLPLTIQLLRDLLYDDRYHYFSLTKLVEELKGLGQVDIFDADARAKATLQCVFVLSWKRIESEEAKRLLQLMSYYPTNIAIPLHLLAVAMGNSEEDYVKARSLRYVIVHLQKLSLIEMYSSEEVRLHTLIRNLVQKYVEEDNEKGQSLREEAAFHLLNAFTNLNKLVKQAQHQGYWQCLELVKAVSWYTKLLRRGEDFKILSRLAQWLQNEGRLLGDTDIWPSHLPNLFYQQLYNHFIEEDGSYEQEYPPMHWIRLEKAVGSRSSSSLWTQNFSSYADVDGFTFSPDSTRVALAVYNLIESQTYIEIYNIVTGRKNSSIKVSNIARVSSIIFTPDNKRIITADALGHVIELDAIKGIQYIIHELRPEEAFTCLAFSPDAAVIAAGTKRGLVHLYNLEDEDEEPPIPCSSSRIENVVFSHDGMLVAVCTNDQVSIWDRFSEICLHQFHTNEQSITCLTFSLDDKWLAFGCRSGGTYIQELSSGTSQKIPFRDNDAVTCLAFSLDNAMIVVGKENASTQIWSRKNAVIDSHDLLAELLDQSEYITHVAFSPDSSYIIIVSKFGTLLAKNVMQSIQFQKLSEQAKKFENLIFSTNGTTVLTLTNEQQIRQWDINKTQASRVLYSEVASQTERLMCVASQQQGNLFGMGMLSGRVLLGDIDHPGNQIELGHHKGRVTCLTFSPDGSLFVTGSKDKTIHLYDTTTRRLVKVLSSHNSSINCLAFAPDNVSFVTSGTDGVIRVWNVVTGACLSFAPTQNLIIKHLCISQNGDTLIAGTNDGEVYMWAKIGPSYSEYLRLGNSTSSEITALAYAPAGNLLSICYSNYQTDFVYLSEIPTRERRLIGKVTTGCIITAINWKSTRHLILAGFREMTNHPSFYHFVLEGN